jgi:hypothetical protein
MSMSLSRRLQILLDEARYRRLEEHARRRGESVAAVVREAIDQLLPDEATDRRRAGEQLLAARPMPVEDWAAMKKQMQDEMSAGGT